MKDLKNLRRKKNIKCDEQKSVFMETFRTLDEDKKDVIDKLLDDTKNTLTLCAITAMRTLEAGSEDSRPKKEQEHLIRVGLSAVNHANATINKANEKLMEFGFPLSCKFDYFVIPTHN
jgi:hypothetical protein